MPNPYDNPNNRYDPGTIRGRQRLEEREKTQKMYMEMGNGNNGGNSGCSGCLSICGIIAVLVVIGAIINIIDSILPYIAVAAVIVGIWLLVRYVRKKKGAENTENDWADMNKNS